MLKRIVCCNGNHAFSHSSNGVIFKAILLPIEGGPTKQLDAHEKLSEDARLVLFDQWVLRNLNAFTFDI